MRHECFADRIIWRRPDVLQSRGFLGNGFLFLLKFLPARITDQAKLTPDGSQTLIGIVLTQKQAMLSATGEHAIRLFGTVRDQIINQHPKVRFMTHWRPRRFIHRLACSVQSSQQALRRSLFVACRTVNLSSKKQPINGLGFQSRLEILRIKIIILDGISWARDMRVFKTFHRMNECHLHIKRQTG